MPQQINPSKINKLFSEPFNKFICDDDAAPYPKSYPGRLDDLSCTSKPANRSFHLEIDLIERGKNVHEVKEVFAVVPADSSDILSIAGETTPEGKAHKKCLKRSCKVGKWEIKCDKTLGGCEFVRTKTYRMPTKEEFLEDVKERFAPVIPRFDKCFRECYGK